MPPATQQHHQTAKQAAESVGTVNDIPFPDINVDQRHRGGLPDIDVFVKKMVNVICGDQKQRNRGNDEHRRNHLARNVSAQVAENEQQA
ncbi:hypothetical protein D3C76_1350600 [compost metagenome]